MEIYSKDDYINNSIISSSLKKVVGNILPHGHNFFELEFIVDGSGIYEIDGVEYEIKKNTLFLMTPANVHSLKNANATIINVMFSREHSGEKNDIAIIPTGSPCFTFKTADGVFLYSLLRELVVVNPTDAAYALLLINCVISKLCHSAGLSRGDPPSYTQRAITYMLENFQSGITLGDAARELGLSTAYFSDLFSKQTGIGFKDYLDDIRFSYAKKLLTLTELSVKEIGFKSGFRDYTNFARRFSQRYGVPPTAYRKTARRRR